MIDWQYWPEFLGLYMFEGLGLSFSENTWRMNRRHSARTMIVVVAEGRTVAYLVAISNIRPGFIFC